MNPVLWCGWWIFQYSLPDTVRNGVKTYYSAGLQRKINYETKAKGVLRCPFHIILHVIKIRY